VRLVKHAVICNRAAVVVCQEADRCGKSSPDGPARRGALEAGARQFDDVGDAVFGERGDCDHSGRISSVIELIMPMMISASAKPNISPTIKARNVISFSDAVMAI
jgi:hypothetical protein